MTTLSGLAAGLAVFSFTIFYAAWHEYTSKNYRDARLLAIIAGSVATGSATAFYS